MDHPLARGDLPFVLRFADDLRNVVADGLRETRGMHRDDVRFVDVKIVLIAWSRLACPPKTEEPSVNELVPAMTGSL